MLQTKDRLPDDNERFLEEDAEFGDTDECIISDQTKKQHNVLQQIDNNRPVTPIIDSTARKGHLNSSKSSSNIMKQQAYNSQFSGQKSLTNGKTNLASTSKTNGLPKQKSARKYRHSQVKSSSKLGGAISKTHFASTTQLTNSQKDNNGLELTQQTPQVKIYETAKDPQKLSFVDQFDPEGEVDFKKAYLKLVKKVFDEQGANILVTQDELDKMSQSQHFNLQEFQKRIQQSLESKNQKTKMQQESKQQQQMQECTFKPQILTQKQKRNFDQFLKDQQQYEENKKQKQKNKKEQQTQDKENQYQKVPIVNKKSAQIVENKKKKENQDQNIHMRLHNIHQERMQKQVQKVAQNTLEMNHALTSRNNTNSSKQIKLDSNNFQSTKSRERDGRQIEDVLYEDAKRRLETHQQKKRQLEKQKDEDIKASKLAAGVNTQRYAAQKFEKEFYYVCQHLLEDENTSENNSNNGEIETNNKLLNYVKLGQLLTELGYLPSNLMPDSIERELLFDIWNLLKGEHNNGIKVKNIKTTLLAIQGISQDYADDNAQVTNDQNDFINESQYGQYNQNQEFRISQKQLNKVFIKFKPLYINRMQHIGQMKRVKHQEEKCSFKPKISKITEQLAQQRRNKILSAQRDENEGSTMQDGDVNPSKVDIVSILLHPINADQQWKQSAKEILDARELEECTFKPRILGYDQSVSQTARIRRGGQDKCKELYSRAKPRHDDKTKNEYDYENGASECTFQPNISQSQKNFDIYSSRCLDGNFDTSTSELTQNIKGYQQVMHRLKKAREDKEKAQMMLTRGIPGTIQDEAQLQPLSFSKNSSYKHNIGASGKLSQQNQKLKQQQPRMNTSRSSDLLGSTFYQKRPQSALIESSIYNADRQVKISHQQNQNSIEQEDQKMQQHSERITLSPEANISDLRTDLKQPLLYVDVNLGPGKSERIVVYDGDTAIALAEQFAQTHGLDHNMQGKLVQLLDGQIDGLLEKIDEEQVSNHSEIF